MRRLAAAFLALSLSLSLPACGKVARTRYEAEFLTLFDTVTQIIGRADSKAQFTEFSQFVHDELETYHRLYDIYHTYDGVNNLKTVNDSAGKSPVKVDRRIIDLLLLSKEMHKKTGGEMNIALGSVLEIWHGFRERGISDPENAELPDRAALEAAAAHIDIDDLVIDEAASTVFLRDPQMRLDVGSVGKGFAVDRVFRKAREKGYADFVLSVGGNVMADGSRDGRGTPWNVALQDPDTDSGKENLLNVDLSGMSLVTSGNYQRYYTVDGKRYHHIIDPDTLFPSEYFAAVSVLSPDSGLADCLSTALYCMPLSDGLALLKSFPGTEAVFIFGDGRVEFSGGFGQYIREE